MTADGSTSGALVHDDASGKREPVETFGDRLAEQVLRRESQIVLGLDPDPARLWPHANELMGGVDHASAPPAVRAAGAITQHCLDVIDAVSSECAFVKPQVACFERLGAPGWQALAAVVEAAASAGLMVIADAKRGDIDVTAQAYADAFLGETASPWGSIPGLGADALTVNPLLGTDSLSPYVQTARSHGRGVFVLARNSNPGAAEFQDLEAGPSGETLSEQIARMIDRIGKPGVGRHGLSDVGAVVGATAAHKLARLRELMPSTVFLVPGVGAQGGQVQDLAPVFVSSPAGGVINSSRGIVNAHEQHGGSPEQAAKREAAGLREQAWALAAAAR